MARDTAANRRRTDSAESDDDGVEEMLRQIGADILDEPVPERLRQLLRPRDRPDSPPATAQGGSDAHSGIANKPATAEQPVRCGDGEPCN